MLHDNFKFTPARQRQYLDAIRRGVGKMNAARIVGMSHEGIRLFYKRDPVFKAARDAAEQESVEAVESSLYNTATNGNVTAQIFFLCNRAPQRWQYRVHADVFARKMSDQDLIDYTRQLLIGNDNNILPLEMLEPNNSTLPLEGL